MWQHIYENITGWSTYYDQGSLMEYILKNLTHGDTIRIAEIGVYMGRCTAMWAIILSNWLPPGVSCLYYGIDHFLGSEEHDHRIDYWTIANRNLEPILSGNQCSDALKLTLVKNDSTLQCHEYPDDYFDVVYIDASHDYESVLKDIELWRYKVRKGGFLCGDDYTTGWQGVMNAVNESVKLSDDFHGFTVIAFQQWIAQRK